MRAKYGRLTLAAVVLTIGTLLALQLPMLGADKGTNTVDVVGVQTGEVFFFASPGGPPAPGDSFVLGYDFYAVDAVEPGAEIGTAHVFCTFGFGPPVCNAVHSLDGRGDIQIQGINTGPPATNVTIIGGSGDFRNAGGDLTITFTGPEDNPGATIHVSHRLTWGRG